MRTPILAAAAALTVAGPVTAANVSVPNQFVSGSPANAAEVNQNFTALADAINAAGGTSFNSDWFLDYSSDGALSSRNAIVLKSEDTDSQGNCTATYRVRVAFNNTASVSVNTPSGSETPDRIFIFGFATAPCSSPAAASFEQEFIYALPPEDPQADLNASFADSLGVEVNWSSGTGTFSNTDSFEYSQTYDRNPLRDSELVHSVESYIDGNGEIVGINDFSHVISPFPRSVTVGGTLNETFSNVALQTFNGYSGQGNRIRVLAQGVGVVQEFNNTTNFSPVFDSNTSNARAIFYRVNGTTGGTLSNTPFAAGELLDGAWFAQ